MTQHDSSHSNNLVLAVLVESDADTVRIGAAVITPMKPIRMLLTLVLGSLVCQSVHAVLFKSIQFVNYATGNLGAAGTGDLEGWNGGTATPQVIVTNGSGSLIGTNLGLVASAGDKVFLGVTNTLSARIQFVPNSTFPPTIETNIYFSLLYRFNNTADVSTDGEVLLRVNRANSGAATPQHWDLLARNVAGQIQLGIAKALGNVTNYATTNIAAGNTVFAVVRQHIITGVQNDVYDLWVNPPTAFFGTNDVDVPPSSASVGALTSDGTEDAGSGTGPGRLTVGSGVNAELDELRIGSSWSEVTPPFGSCVGAAFESHPASVTQSAEISATFNVKALSTATSPSVQWQRSTNSGGTWDNISGATAATYTTPNLSLAESGSQYRAIVSVACNSSSATSTVATVTLTNPVVTPVGLVMHDLFEDSLRDDPPVTVSNSVWRTATSANLDAFTTPGVMVATPLPGSSSLWLGYFTDSDAGPVHLSVGRTLKITFPFTPNSFNAFTNNAGLRIGLFDYHDGGTRLAADGAAAGGSRGNGVGVRGYLLNLDWGTNFSVNSPVQLLARNFLTDDNLMGSIGDYTSFGSGPAGGGYIGAPAFQAGSSYTLVLTVARPDVNSVDFTAAITGGGTNWSHSITDTNFAYHRFDAFGIRPNSLETSVDSFTIPEFLVEVSQGAVSVVPFNITSVESLGTGSVKLTWNSVSGAVYHILSSDTISAPLMGWITNGTVVATGASSSYTNSGIAAGVTNRFYRVMATP